MNLWAGVETIRFKCYTRAISTCVIHEIFKQHVLAENLFKLLFELLQTNLNSIDSQLELMYLFWVF